MTLHISLSEHARAIKRCLDIPQQKPSFPMPLPEVGISGKTVWVRLPAGTIPFAARLEVSLGALARGIHMSRLEEVITGLHAREFADLREYALALGGEMLARQGAEQGRVRLRGQLPLLRTATASKRQSLDSIEVGVDLRLKAGADGSALSLLYGVGVNHITACPCTQAYNQVLFNKTGGDPCPLSTHSQRSHTRLQIGADARAPELEEIRACLEKALHVTQDLLKRPDEAELVFKSHAAPQFAEDAVREVARQAGLYFGPRLPAETPVIIESLSLESIHIHDVCCRLQTTLAEIRACLPEAP
ncbi:GTP cyclohydrolase, FolE2/MptA family [Thiovibrio sp. JS02]